MFDELDDLFPLFHRILLFDSSLSILSIGIQKFFPQRIIFRVEFFDFSDDIFCGRRVGVESQSSCEPVSYTHLDVYKRQGEGSCGSDERACGDL